MNKMIGFIFSHKLVLFILLLLGLGIGYYEFFMVKNSNNEIKYVLGKVEKGTIISSVSGGGQVSASNQIDIKPKASGDLVKFDLKNGQEVKEGDLIAQIDDTVAQKAYKDAQTSLETSKLDLAKFIQPADEFTVSQAENDLAKAKNDLDKLKSTQETDYRDALDSKQKAEDSLIKAYEDAYNTISNAYLDLPAVKTDLWNVLYSYEIVKSDITAGNNTWNKGALSNTLTTYEEREELEKFISKADTDYASAETKFEKSYQDYKNSSRASARSDIEYLLAETIETARAMADTVKSEINMLDYWIDARSQRDLKIFSKVNEYETTLKSDTSKTNSHLSSALSAQSSIKSGKDSLESARQSIVEMDKNNPIDMANAEWNIKVKENAMAELKAGPDDLDVRAKKIAVQQKQDALNEAWKNLANYKIYVPFDGVIADVGVKKGDAVSSGTVVATLLTKQGMAEISLNEIDIAKIKVSQKAILTFDAVPDFSMTGKVVEIGTIGAVSQGVVSYTVKVNFDTQDDRVKPGMSVSVNIIIESKQDVLLAPLNAVKSAGDDGSYVEILIDGKPRRKTVVTGSSNDTMIEIVEGLEENDQIVTQTINTRSTSAKSGSSSTSNNRNQDPMRALGGMMR